jgi:hypothetical protein
MQKIVLVCVDEGGPASWGGGKRGNLGTLGSQSQIHHARAKPSSAKKPIVSMCRIGKGARGGRVAAAGGGGGGGGGTTPQ